MLTSWLGEIIHNVVNNCSYPSHPHLFVGQPTFVKDLMYIFATLGSIVRHSTLVEKYLTLKKTLYHENNFIFAKKTYKPLLELFIYMFLLSDL